MLKKIKNIYIDGSIDTKICLISDIHFYRNYNNKIFDLILETVKNNKPDYVCIPGDIIDIPNLSIKELEPLFNFLEELGNICKVIISLGNHDLSVNHSYFYNEPYIDNLSKINNIYLLINDDYIDNNIRFIGIKDNVVISHKEKGMDKIVIKDYNELFNKIKMDDNKYNILLAHNPIYLVRKDIYSKIVNWNKLNLVLSGHTHGGLMPEIFNCHFGIISPSKRFFPKDIRGKYILDKVNLIISNGIVKLSYCSKFLKNFNFLFPVSIYYINIKKSK